MEACLCPLIFMFFEGSFEHCPIAPCLSVLRNYEDDDEEEKETEIPVSNFLKFFKLDLLFPNQEPIFAMQFFGKIH